MAGFGKALDILLGGGTAMRKAWAGYPGMGLKLQFPFEGSEATLPYFIMFGPKFAYPWFPSTDDLLAQDWEQYREKSKILRAN